MRTTVIKTRAIPEEKKALVQIAYQERESTSQALRDLIRQEARRRGLWPPKDNPASPGQEADCSSFAPQLGQPVRSQERRAEETNG